MKQTNKKNEKGFTMIELIIVVAIMAIIGAVLVPTFSNMSTKARITSDVTSVKTLQKQLEVFKATDGSYPTTFPTSSAALVPSTALNDLVVADFIDGKDLTSGGNLKLQTDAELYAEAGKCYLQLPSGSKYASYVGGIKEKDGNYGWIKK